MVFEWYSRFLDWKNETAGEFEYTRENYYAQTFEIMGLNKHREQVKSIFHELFNMAQHFSTGQRDSFPPAAFVFVREQKSPFNGPNWSDRKPVLYTRDVRALWMIKDGIENDDRKVASSTSERAAASSPSVLSDKTPANTSLPPQQEPANGLASTSSPAQQQQPSMHKMSTRKKRKRKHGDEDSSNAEHRKPGRPPSQNTNLRIAIVDPWADMYEKLKTTLPSYTDADFIEQTVDELFPIDFLSPMDKENHIKQLTALYKFTTTRPYKNTPTDLQARWIKNYEPYLTRAPEHMLVPQKKICITYIYVNNSKFT